MNTVILEVEQVCKTFILHHQQGISLPVLKNIDLTVHAGESVVLDAPSGMGKSTLLKLIYGNYRASEGAIRLRQQDGSYLDLLKATPRQMLHARRHHIAYVSQFLRVIPRVSAIDIVAEPLLGTENKDSSVGKMAYERASEWLEMLRIPERLWHLPPATFSGGEQQRINIARNLIQDKPLVLLDEPTASLDAENVKTVVRIVQGLIHRGIAVVGIFHDKEVGKQLATRYVNMEIRGA